MEIFLLFFTICSSTVLNEISSISAIPAYFILQYLLEMKTILQRSGIFYGSFVIITSISCRSAIL
jgi:hypothetical protein